jgi:hypothetical protein
LVRVRKEYKMLYLIKESIESFRVGYMLNRLDYNSFFYGVKGGIKELKKDIKGYIRYKLKYIK